MEGTPSSYRNSNIFWTRFENNMDFYKRIPPVDTLPNNTFIVNNHGLSQKSMLLPTFDDWSKFYWTVTPEKKDAVHFWPQDEISLKEYPELPRDCFSGPASPVKPFITQYNHKSTYYPVSHKVCNFCRQNGDRREFYSEHRLKDKSGKVECPVLRRHVCETCRATGDYAHTKSYCPLFRKLGNMSKNAAHLKRTLHDSCGRIRR